MLELLLCPRKTSQRLQALLHGVAQREQVVRIGGGVRQHRRRQRPERPIRLLVLLGELHAGVLLEQRGQADGRLTGELRRDARIEQAHGVKPVVAIEHAEIIVSVVEDFFELGISEQHPEWTEVWSGNRDGIDDRGLRRARHLEQVDAIAIPMEARALGIDADARLPAHGSDERRKVLRRVDVLHSCFPSASIPAAICSSALANVL